MSIYIESERFIIRELLPEDEEGFFRMDNDPEVHRYVGGRPLQIRKEVQDVIQFVRKQYTDNGVGRWAVIEKETNDFLGWTGFKLMTETVNGHVNHYDFGYRLARHAWGKGVATESGRAALEYGLGHLKFDPVFAMTNVENKASRHVLEKLGFRFVKIFEYDGAVSWHKENELMTTWYEWPGNRTP